LLLLPLEFQQLLLPVLLQQLLEPFSLLPPPFLFFFFSFPSRLLLLLLQLLLLLLQLLLLLLQLLLRLPLTLFFFLLPPLLDGVEPDGPRRPPRDGGSLELLIHGAGVLRGPVAARPIADSNRIPRIPRSGRLRGSLLLWRVRRLDPPR
jgi:hypothetical protein